MLDKRAGKLSVHLDPAIYQSLSRFPFRVNEIQRLSSRRSLPQRMPLVPVAAALFLAPSPSA